MRADGAVEGLIGRRVAERAGEWFPALEGRPSVELRELSNRPRSLLFKITVRGGDRVARVLAKVRRGQQEDPVTGAAGRRPRLSSGTLPASELTALEFAGLEAIYRGMGGAASPFRAARPLDQLIEHDAILMEFVDGSTLRNDLTAGSRFATPWLRSRGQAPSDAWRQVGALLRAYQESTSRQAPPARQRTRADVVAAFESYQDFLSARVGARSFGDLGKRGAELAAAVLPEQLPLVVGHGDFAPRNVLLGTDGRLTLIDPLPRWSVPLYEDLCRFLVGIRLLGVQVHTHGTAFSRHRIEGLENQVLDGYYRGQPTRPVAQVRCYQLLLLLDRWAALLEQPGGGAAAWRTRSVGLASGFLRDQAGRLLDLAADPR